MQGSIRRLCSRRLTWVVAALATGGAAAGATQALASDSSGNTVYACVSNQTGNVQIVAEGVTCSHNQYATSWNVTGPQGPQGPKGDTGPQGPAGASAPDPAPRQNVVGTVTLTPAGIPGESTDTTPITFKIYDFSASQDQSLNIGSQSGGSGAGKVTFNPITMTKLPDASSPGLLDALDTGGHFASAKVQLYAPDGTTVEEKFEYRLVYLKSIATTNSGAASDQLFEQLTLEVGTVTETVGSSTSSWNIVTNSPA